VLVIIILILGLFFYQRSTTQAKAQKEKNSYKVKRLTLKDTLSLSGTIDAEEHSILRFQSSGRLAWVGVKEGDYVKKFQTVASLDQRSLADDLKKYLNTYTKERLDFDSSKQNNELKYTGSLSEDARRDALRSLDKAQYDLNNAVLDVELKNLALQYSNQFSPFEGLVVRVDSPFAGVNITPAQAEFEIINPKTIYFSATADQTDVVKIRENLTGSITLDSYPEDTLHGEVSHISFIPKSGETGTVYAVKIALSGDNTNYKYRFGMTGDANFTLKERQNVIAVPSNYLKSEKGKKYVLKSENGKISKIFIQTDEEIDNNTIVTSGLEQGDIIYD